MITLSDLSNLRSGPALRRFIDQQFRGDEEAFVKGLSQELNSLLRTDLNRASAFLSKARPCFKHLPQRFQANLLAMWARLHHWKGEYEPALESYSQALELFRRRRDSESVARLGRGLMDVHMYLGNYREAIRIGQNSLRLFRRRGDSGETARVLTNIGNVYHRLDNNRLALRYYDKAKEILKKEGGAALAVVQYNRANIFANLNRLNTARALYESSADLYRRARMHIAEAQAHYSLAYLAFLEDKYTEALRLFEQVSERFAELGYAKASAVTTLDLVELNIHLNQFGTAIMLGEDAGRRFEALGMRYERAKTHYFVCLAQLHLGDYGHASKSFRLAHTLFAQENNLLWQGMV
ncbi:MAG: tetratricopeptide repeat protein, partial [Candidatus Zixiibacteriota bacterium]